MSGHAVDLEDAVDVEHAAAGKSAGEPEPDEDDAASSFLVPPLPADEPQDGLGGRGEDDIGGLAAGLAVVDARVEQQDAVLAHRHRHGAGAAGGGGRRDDHGEVAGVDPAASLEGHCRLLGEDVGGREEGVHARVGVAAAGAAAALVVDDEVAAVLVAGLQLAGRGGEGFAAELQALVLDLVRAVAQAVLATEVWVGGRHGDQEAHGEGNEGLEMHSSCGWNKFQEDMSSHQWS